MRKQRSVLAALIGIVLAVSAVGTADANDSPEFEAYEAKIEARQLADGSIEVAVRARDIGGEWGDRLYPRAFPFWLGMTEKTWTIPPAWPGRYHWQASEAIELELQYQPDRGHFFEPGHGLRVVARRHENGRTEIALRASLDVGVWTSPIIFPERRFFPAAPNAGWYETSTVTVSNEVVAPDGYPSDAVTSFVYEDALNRVYYYMSEVLNGYSSWEELHAEIAPFAAALSTFPVTGTHDCLPGMMRSLGYAAQAMADAIVDLTSNLSWRAASLLMDLVASYIRDSVANRFVCFLPV
ncbi:MAG: hypothetical protein F4X98_18125 [Gammaproteobacteria bacterium]|nr:hypothetical protein [Gammaproteobacteria bacterium]